MNAIDIIVSYFYQYSYNIDKSLLGWVDLWLDQVVDSLDEAVLTICSVVVELRLSAQVCVHVFDQLLSQWSHVRLIAHFTLLAIEVILSEELFLVFFLHCNIKLLLMLLEIAIPFDHVVFSSFDDLINFEVKLFAFFTESFLHVFDALGNCTLLIVQSVWLLHYKLLLIQIMVALNSLKF